MTYPKGGAEYGGYPGLVQPLPHEVKDSGPEQLMLAQMTEAADPGDGIEQAADRIRAQAVKDKVKQHGS